MLSAFFLCFFLVECNRDLGRNIYEYYSLNMRRILLLITIFVFFVMSQFAQAFAEADPLKVLSLNYDNNSSIIYVKTQSQSETSEPLALKYIKLTNPNRIYFDINNSVLIGEKKQLVFENSPIKEIKLAQFETVPNKIVRAVITFAEDYDVSKIKLFSIDGNIIVRLSKPALSNDYFNLLYDDSPKSQNYSSIAVNSHSTQKVDLPPETQIKAPSNVMEDIQRAFESSTIQNSDGKTYDSTVSTDLSTDLKLRTKYFINQYSAKNGGLLVSGLGQMTTAMMFYLTEPNRAVIDLPNTFLDREIRNKEIRIGGTDAQPELAKIGQFEHDTARIVITSENVKKYLPIYSQDMQSLFLINSDNLDHTSLVTNVSNINKFFVRKVDNKTNELIISFTSPIVHSILRTDNSLNLYFFNVKSYNEEDMVRTLTNSYYKKFTVSLLPQIGVRAGMQINKNDIVRIEESVDAKAIKITVTRSQDDIKVEKPSKRPQIKGRIVLDAGHGGTDYGAIREGVNEKDLTLDITQRVEAILRSKGYKIALTRNDDTYLSLEERVEFAEGATPELFISIHVNSSVSSDPNGIETHYYHDYSKSLAEVIHKHMIKEINAKDRGLFKSKFYVINHTTVPAVLCEVGFLSNDAERNDLVTDSRKQKTAKAIAEGIIEYLKTGRK